MLGNHKYRALVFPGKLQIAGIQMERFIIQVVKSHLMATTRLRDVR